MTDDNKQPPVGDSTPEKYSVTTISPQELITVSISGYFLNRVQQLLLSMCAEVGGKETLEIYKRVTEGKPAQSTHEEAIIILTTLADAIGKAAVEQNKVTEKECTAEEAVELFDAAKAILSTGN